MAVSTAEFRYKGMAVAATRSTTRHQTSIPLNNSHAVLTMATVTKTLSPYPLLGGSHLRQAQVALPVGLPHHPLGLMDPMAESRCNPRQATHNPQVMAIARSLDVGPRVMVSLMIVDDQGTRIGEKTEIHTEDSGIHIADNIEAVKHPDANIDEKYWLGGVGVAGKGSHHRVV